MTIANFDLLILSPHLDDAILSCGGIIIERTRAGQRVLIVTVMAGDPPPGPVSSYAGSLESRWELVQQAAAARRAEDIRACRHVGADWDHWDIPDCIYRRHPQSGETFYNSDREIFGEIHPAEMALITQLRQKMIDLPPANEVFVPLGIGHHVDHQLTRAAAEQWGIPLIYYEDYPYAQKPGAVSEMIAADDKRWQSQTSPISPERLQQKIEAIELYDSQLSTFFADRQDLARQVRHFSTQVGGERTWRVKITP
ncbi:MAG: PIG-L family deacetylase [Ardenticatenaceae bacterium]|nr:PIG-L family deacetylase [Ardenticatenaceae bacterium]